jgi:hypothetical protein
MQTGLFNLPRFPDQAVSEAPIWATFYPIVILTDKPNGIKTGHELKTAALPKDGGAAHSHGTFLPDT